MPSFILAILAIAAEIFCLAAKAVAADNNDGTFTNPPLYADYPDPDIIRVNDDFYFGSTTFVNVPGLVLLHSKDLVNWETVGYVIDRLDGDGRYDMSGGTMYRNGVFAPSLRYHKGTFYIAVTPNGKTTRIYSSQDIRGPWKCVDLHDGSFDPGLFFDDDGTPYLFTSGGWDGHVTLKTLSPELDKVVASRQIFYVKGIEGSKALKINGWYYLFNALPGKLALMCSRAKALDGPWETIQVLDDKTGGHQGALVDLPDGSWYGFVMRDSGAVGRMTNICPITWKDEWPLWGEPDSLGKVPEQAKKPIDGMPIINHPASTDFDSAKLPLEWQWNHNPDDARWSLTERAGFLRLKATAAPDFWNARNSLTHKGWGPTSCAVAKLDISHLQSGDVAGLGMLGKSLATLAVQRSADGPTKLILSTGVEHNAPVAPTATADIGNATVVHLALQMDFTTKRARCTYSLDGEAFTPIGDEFPLMFDWRTGTFQGEQYALFCYNPQPSDGYLDVDSVTFKPIAAAQPSAQSGNPIFRDVFTADPAPLVYKDTLYRYVGHDEAKGKEMFNMTEWLCFSTTDMKTWTPRGRIMKPTDFKWAVGDAWASQVMEKDGKFYLYATVQHDKSHNGKAIGVAVSDKPTGPFTDARGTALVTNEMTPHGKVGWEDIDPTVFTDTDGTTWLCWGNANCYLAKLEPNLIELDGPISEIEVPHYTEGPWLHKRGDVYYLTYAAFAHEGKSESICYATAPAITGPWTYQGILTGTAANSYTIHPGIIEFKNQWYLFYHNAVLKLPDGQTGGLGRRSVCVEYLYYNPDGTIKPIEQTTAGVTVPAAAAP